MRWLDRSSSRAAGKALMRRLLPLLGPILGSIVALFGARLGHCAPADEAALRHRADIVVERPAAFVKLPLPPSAYARSVQPGLQDLRVLDARGERVPFALLAPRPDEPLTREQARAATLYPLPPRPTGSATWHSPVEISVDGDRIQVKRRGGATAPAPVGSPGWLLDLGERARDEPRPSALRLQWSGPAEFSAGYALESSDDLRSWRSAGAGQVMALASAAGVAGTAGYGAVLTQPLVALPEGAGRFVRLVWADVSSAPQLSAALVLTRLPGSLSLDPPAEWTVEASAEAAAAPVQGADAAAAARDAKRALHFDLGAPVPLVELDLDLGSATQVVPLRVQVRTRADEAWQPAVGAVFYRFESGGALRRSPPLALQRTARYVRLVPDERAAALDPAQVRLKVRAQLSSLVFATQGAAPYALLAGSREASPGALPLATLVPALDEERARFGLATLGPWREVEAAARQAETAERRAALRPWLLWGVLIAGAAGLAFMVWRLARGGR